MGKYAVKLTEKLSRTYIIEADTFEDASDILASAYLEGSTEPLDSNDFDEWETDESQTFRRESVDENDERLELFTVLESEEN